MSGRRVVAGGIAAGLLFAAAGTAIAQAEPRERIAQAVTAYGEAMESDRRDTRLAGFRNAERLFAAAIEEAGGSAELYANLGNAALQSDRLGHAVLAYRRALLLEPGLERARQNLVQIRQQLPDWVPTPQEGGALDTFFFWHRTLSRSVRTELAALCFLAAALALAASIQQRSSLLRTAAIVPAIGWVALAGSLASGPTRAAIDEAVVIDRDAIARAADSINAPSRFGEALPPGTELTVLEDRGGWLRIRLHNGRSAWLTSTQIERIGG